MICPIDVWKVIMKHENISSWAELSDSCLTIIDCDNEEGFVIVKANTKGLEWDE